jgi:hypothetical protein
VSLRIGLTGKVLSQLITMLESCSQFLHSQTCGSNRKKMKHVYSCEVLMKGDQIRTKNKLFEIASVDL